MTTDEFSEDCLILGNKIKAVLFKVDKGVGLVTIYGVLGSLVKTLGVPRGKAHKMLDRVLDDMDAG